MFERIIIPTDGSETVKKAVDIGIKLGYETGDKVIALYVVDISLFSALPPDSLSMDIFSLLNKEAYSAVNYVVREGKKHNVYVETKILEGIPSQKIVEFAGENDIIVISTKTRTKLEKILIESVTDKVLRNAKCPVLLVKSK